MSSALVVTVTGAWACAGGFTSSARIGADATRPSNSAAASVIGALRRASDLKFFDTLFLTKKFILINHLIVY
jgi:hypothetical protein